MSAIPIPDPSKRRPRTAVLPRSESGTRPGPAAVLVLVVLLLGVAALPAAEHTVNISGLNFVPADLTISVGDTVTWVNDGGQHNVVSDNPGDPLFTSGPPSTDDWEYSFTFHDGGVYPYFCEVHVDQGMTGTITVEGIFGDGLESGDPFAWDAMVPEVPFCDCYFSSDCVAGQFCNYGPGGFATEDICWWRDNKPNGNPGTGCDIDHVGPWGGDICDGVCQPSSAGSQVGHEDPAVLAKATFLWAEAMLRPSEAGGGPLDASMVDAVEQLEFIGADNRSILGRHVADLLIQAGVPQFYPYYCHAEQYPDDTTDDEGTWIDLSDDPCRVAIARTLAAALRDEIEEPDSCGPMIAEVPEQCADWQERLDPACGQSAEPLACLEEHVRSLGVFVTTPDSKRPPVLDFARSLGATAR